MSEGTPWMHPPERVARYGLTSYLAHLAHLVLDLVPWPVRPVLWRLLLQGMGRGVILEHRVFIRPPAKVWIGHDVFIGRGSQLWAHADAGIVIGDHVLLGPDVLVTTLGHRYEDPAMPVTARPVAIGNRCWIGARSVILPGVTLGDGVVVAAGSVVAEDIPAWTVVAGVPARLVKRRELEEPAT